MEKSIRKSCHSAVFFLAVFLFAGCGKSSAKPTVKVAYLPITHALVLHETAKSKEVDVQLIRYGSWPELLDALCTGRVDAASVLIEPAMKAKAQGIDLAALALGHRDGNVIIVGNNINSAEDLRGKTFAIPHRASSHYLLLCELLTKNNIPANAVKITELAPSEMPSALATGRIAGYCVAEPFGAIAVEGAYGKVLVSSHELWQDSICCALLANGRFLKENPELARRFLTEYKLAGENLADKEQAYVSATEFLKQPPAVLKRSLEWITFGNLDLTAEAYGQLAKLLKQYKVLEDSPAYENFAGDKL
ncbi:MAG: ABC transporter substrate-binding protein [Victivallales bacterium]|jgi:NitT/TauT family transport system substrate-binding protein|nr:ABC transporter substrate-binding protein [Victivallales bacterium]